ncbi:MAG TPA: patatin-like phospholipase family protein, partial [Gammaproteobacteria bacterium]|nr:patatin-like phospholipase family protein [Gammaproteobacteria bacterium]
MHVIHKVAMDQAIHNLLNFYKNKKFCKETIHTVLTNLAFSQSVTYPKPPITGAAFKGGGVKVLAHIGAILAHDIYGHKGIDRLKYVAGSSGGGIVAFLIAMGFSALQIFEFVNHIKLTDFLDTGQKNNTQAFPLSNVVDFIKSGSIHSGENFRNWALSIIEFVLGS